MTSTRTGEGVPAWCEWLLAAGGVLSIAFGVLLLVRPEASALALVWMVGSLGTPRWRDASPRPASG